MTFSLTDILRKRLIAVGAIMTLLNMAFVAAYYGSDIEFLRLEMVDRQVEAIADAISVENGQPVFRLSEARRRLFERHPYAYGFRVSGKDRVIAEANPELVRHETASGSPTADVSWGSGGTKSTDVLTGARRLNVAGVDLEVAFAAVTDPAWLTFRLFLEEQVRHVLIPLVPFAILLTIVNIATVRKALAPIKQAADATLRVSETLQPIPVPLARLPSEVATLVSAANVALGRLSHALESEKAFTADAAHALRTPLAVLNARIANLPDGPVKADLTTDVGAMRKLIGQLLLAAQADQLEVSPSSRCDIRRTAEDVVATMAPVAIAANRSLALDAPEDPISIVGDSDALAHALRNLIDNALKFAPVGTEVTVVVTAAPSLAVLDRGPGIPDADKPHVRKRFWHSGGEGTGLGLAIVSRIAEAHGATVTIADRDGGGTSVTLQFSR